MIVSTCSNPNQWSNSKQNIPIPMNYDSFHHLFSIFHPKKPIKNCSKPLPGSCPKTGVPHCTERANTSPGLLRAKAPGPRWPRALRRRWPGPALRRRPRSFWRGQPERRGVHLLCALEKWEFTWRFPKMGVALNHPLYFRIFHSKPFILGYLILWKPPYG